MIRSLLIVLLGTCLVFNLAAAGDWTANEFIYKPDIGARGQAEKNIYDSGQDRLDARLAKEHWVGDPKLGNSPQSAISALGGTACILRMAPGTYSLSADLTVPANITLAPERGAVINVATTKTLTLNGGILAGPWQVFSWVGTGAIQINGPDRTLLAEWFGASTAAADNGPAVQKAFASFGSAEGQGGGTLVFGHGTYTFTSPAASGTTPAPDITFKGQGCGQVDLSSTPHGTVLKYTGTGTLFPLHPSSFLGGWHWRDLGIYCNSTGSAIELGDTSAPPAVTVNRSSLRNVGLHGTGGNFGLAGCGSYYMETDESFWVRGFKWGVYLRSSDGNRLRGVAWLNNQNVRIVSDYVGGLYYGSENSVRMMLSYLADYGDSRYLVYDTATHTKYEHCQYEGASGDSAFYVNGRETIFENCNLGALGGGRIGPDAKNIWFICPTGGGDTPWVVDAPTSCQSEGFYEPYVYVLKPQRGVCATLLPYNPRIVVLADSRTGNVDASGNPHYDGGLDKAEAATHSLGAFMGQPGGHSTQMLLNAFTKGWLPSQAGVSWVADANASVGWAIKLAYNDDGSKNFYRWLKVGQQVNSGDTLVVTLRYRTAEAVTGGAIAFSVFGTTTGWINAYDPVSPTPGTSYQVGTKTWVLPALTFGETLEINLTNGLTGAGGHLDVYLDYLAIVPTAQVLRSRAFAVEKQGVAYAATVTPDWGKGGFLEVGQLTGAIQLLNPSVAAVVGQKVYVKLAADGTNRAVTYDTAYKATYAQVTANKTAVLELLYDGTSYIQVGTVQEN